MERLRRALEPLQALERGGERLAGMTLPGPGGTPFVVERVAGEAIVLVPPGGSGRAAVHMNLAQVAENDLLELLRKLDPAATESRMAALLLGQAMFARADPLLRRLPYDERAAFMRSWSADWQRTGANLTADRLLDDLRPAVEREKWDEARALMENLRRNYYATDVLRWMRRDEFQELADRVPAAPASVAPPATARRAPAPPPSAPPAGPAASGDDNEGDTGGTEQFSPAEVRERLISLNGKTIRLKFRYRGMISQRDEKTYQSIFLDDGGSVPVTFGEEGYKWIKDINSWNAKNNRLRTVYGVVNAAGQEIKLLGRNRRILLGKNAPEYSW